MSKDNKDKNTEPGNEGVHNIQHLPGMYEGWFLDYASYVILERAVPHVNDGLKPVQRRILHSMYELEDGRYNKVANLIGNTMKYHPHGDASIGDALVQIGQKDILIDAQGNWGNILTGDSAAAARYIEARLSKFALEVVFNPKTTHWLSSYDGRNKEPETLPVKFPLLLAQGVEGIAVGLACKILPHNFNELIDASITSLKGRKTNLLPDFPTGGQADFSNYNEGMRGGKIRIRARIRQEDKKTLIINEIPFGTTTGSLIESILTANDKGKIKIRKVEDNTAENVEIVIHLAPGIDPDKTIDALYAFTDCEISISPNACVIDNDKPVFISVNDILKRNTSNTLELLKRELEIRLGELQEDWHFSSLEKIFIEKRIYREIENCTTWESVIETIDKGLKPYKKKFLREITREDIVKLTEIRIKRISKFDGYKADEHIKALEDEIKVVKGNLSNLTEYAIEYFKNLKKKYGTGRERKTEIRNFEVIEKERVIVLNEKLYVNREEGFIGTGLRKDEFVCDCSDIDEIITFCRDGIMKVTKVADKVFVGKDIIHVAVFKRGDDKTVYNMIYRDGHKGMSYIKRFNVGGVTRDKNYNLTRGTAGSEVLYFTANPGGESEKVRIILKPLKGLRKTEFDLNFSDLAVKGRDVMGNQITKYPIKKIIQTQKGRAAVATTKIWFDDSVHRLNSSGKGTYLGEFTPEDRILTITQGGYYRLTGFDLSIHFEEDIILIEKFNPEQPVSAVYYDGDKRQYMVKRFIVESSRDKVLFITDHANSRLEIATTQKDPVIEVNFKDKDKRSRKIKLNEYIELMGARAKGNKLDMDKIKDVDLLPPVEEKITFKKGESDFEDVELSPVAQIKQKVVKEKEAKNKRNKGDQTKLF